MIGKRITKRSSDKEEFDKASNEYNLALERSGHQEKIKYEPETTPKKRTRKRKTIWFNPPFCLTVKTKIARTFIQLVKKHFNKENPLHKIINKNTVNISYSCMANMRGIINKHNRKILQDKKDNKVLPCNCRKFDCPLKDSKYSCQTEGVVYQATVHGDGEPRHYVGLTANKFKERWYQHRHDFKNETKRESTELSKHIWYKKNKQETYEITWKILKKITKINNGNKMCRLCITEAAIIMKGKKGQLNKRNEIMNKCRHQNKFLLKNWKERKKN